MEVVAASPSSAGNGTMPPYQRRDVEEWSHLDRLTGMLEHARVETDHWAANTHNSQHKYGKVVDSRDRCAPDGSQQQRQRRQLEVFQAHVPGGSLQVIRTQTVATSSSRWSSASSTQTTAAASAQQTNASSLQGFENLQLALNPLDLSSQKTKASVGRSGSIGGRRPPSRPRSLIGARRVEPDAAVSARLQRVSRLCQQLHNETITSTSNSATSKPSILERQNGDGSVSSDHFENSESSKNSIDHFWNKTNDTTTETNNAINHNEWKKSSELSRNRSYSDIDADRRLNTALRGNNVDLEALDQILKSISSSTSNYSDKISLSDDFKSDEQPEKDETEELKEVKSKKRHSFITVESLQEVRGRLRRLSSPIDGYKSIEYAKEEEPDDGIADAEDPITKKEEPKMPASNSGVSRVRSYVYGMEAMLHNKKPIIGTGSLESRTSSKSNGVSTNRSEDWYNRRKSYGFEQVHNQQIDQTNSISLRGKNKIESSTDSGICRSTEIVVVPSVFKPQYNNKFSSSKIEVNDETTNRKFNSQQITTSYGKIGNSTVINLNGDNNKTSSVLSNNSDNSYKQNNELFNVWNRRALFSAEDNSNQQSKKDSEQTTITIPIVAEENNDSNNRRMYHRQMSDGSSMSIESSWPKNKTENQEIKRHSIAVDESKYVTNRYNYNQDKRISLAAESLLKDDPQNNDQQEEDSTTNLNKKQKKVEFCKTEVHFAAESGRVNIVETDEKPPPTQNFRRRRRNSSVTSNHVPENYNKTGLPLIHFGDTTYEKKLFGVSDQEAAILNEDIYNKDNFASMLQENSNNVTVSSVSVNQDYEPEREIQENESLPRGILKNKMIKPKPYILGDENNELLSKETSNEDQDSLIWGVRLKPVHKQEENSQPTSTAPLWRSTVTVQNTSYNNSINKREVVLEENVNEDMTSNSKPEFQKLLYSLRPARKSEPSIMTPEVVPVEKRSTAIDLRRSSWSVADRIKQVEDLKQENKGYSTRVNFGSGETTVVENGDIEKHTTWPRQEELHAKDISSIKSSFSSNIHKTQSNASAHFDKHRSSDAKITSITVPLARKNSDSSIKESPKVGRKVNSIKRNFETRSTYSNGYLSSPSLVDNSSHKATTKTNKSEAIEKKFQTTEERINSFSNKVSSITSKESPNSRRKTFNSNRKPSPNISPYSYTKQSIPKKFEASSNFEETKSGKTNKQWFDNRPDLLKNHDSKAYVNLSTVIKEENKSTTTNTSKKADIRKVTPTKTRPDSPSINRPESPIYENIDEVISNLNAMERESCMLQELTKAADQILQAVNGYTDEDSKLSTDSEEDGKKHRLKLRQTADLGTISETKSWKQVQNKSTKLTSKNVKSRVRATSSTSSIESLTKETKPIPPVRLNRAAKLNEERTKKKITGSNSELSKITKARRLQRASSREALLQSHGSSSEDIAVNTDIRKPRLVRKPKGNEDISRKSSVSQTNSIVSTKKKEYDSRRYSDRVPVIGLQEIRHKTAISTIKSTAEKAASREKALKAKEEMKKRTAGKRDTTSSKGSNTVSSHHGTISTHRSSTSGQCRGADASGAAGGQHSRHPELSGAAVRTSSGVNRKYSRNEGPTKL